MKEDVFKPKSKEEIDETINRLIGNSATLIKFLKENQIKHYRTIKAYDYVCKLLGNSPLNIYVIYYDTDLFNFLYRDINDVINNNLIREVVKPAVGPIKTIWVYKNLMATCSNKTLLISKKNILSIMSCQY
jgi:hypothetical protein